MENVIEDMWPTSQSLAWSNDGHEHQEDRRSPIERRKALHRVWVQIVLDDGGGIGWALGGSTMIPGLGQVGLECPGDPDYELCLVSVPADRTEGALRTLLNYFGLQPDDVLETY